MDTKEADVLDGLRADLRLELEAEFIDLIKQYKNQLEWEDIQFKLDECLSSYTALYSLSSPKS
jgi:hypothetical protein